MSGLLTLRDEAQLTYKIHRRKYSFRETEIILLTEIFNSISNSDLPDYFKTTYDIDRSLKNEDFDYDENGFDQLIQKFDKKITAIKGYNRLIDKIHPTMGFAYKIEFTNLEIALRYIKYHHHNSYALEHLEYAYIFCAQDKDKAKYKQFELLKYNPENQIATIAELKKEIAKHEQEITSFKARLIDLELAKKRNVAQNMQQIPPQAIAESFLRVPSEHPLDIEYILEEKVAKLKKLKTQLVDSETHHHKTYERLSFVYSAKNIDKLLSDNSDLLGFGKIAKLRKSFAEKIDKSKIEMQKLSLKKNKSRYIQDIEDGSQPIMAIYQNEHECKGIIKHEELQLAADNNNLSNLPPSPQKKKLRLSTSNSEEETFHSIPLSSSTRLKPLIVPMSNKTEGSEYPALQLIPQSKSLRRVKSEDIYNKVKELIVRDKNALKNNGNREAKEVFVERANQKMQDLNNIIQDAHQVIEDLNSREVNHPLKNDIPIYENVIKQANADAEALKALSRYGALLFMSAREKKRAIAFSEVINDGVKIATNCLGATPTVTPMPSPMATPNSSPRSGVA